MDLSAYTHNQLQAARVLLAGAAAAGLALAELRALLDQALPSVPVVMVRPAPPAPPPRLCPSCGRGPLTPVLNHDGLRIVGCSRCRYSEVMDNGIY